MQKPISSKTGRERAATFMKDISPCAVYVMASTSSSAFSAFFDEEEEEEEVPTSELEHGVALEPYTIPAADVEQPDEV